MLGRKFLGLCITAATVAALCLGSATNQADTGFVDRNPALAQCNGGAGLQSFSAFSSCSGGGAGLQSFSDCSGGGGLTGGGPGLQYAPQAYYAPTYWAPQYTGYGTSSPCGPMGCPVTYSAPRYYQPTYYVRSAPIVSVPTYVQRPRVNFGLLNFSVGQASPPVPLNAGETYVAGSLRQVIETQSVRHYSASTNPVAKAAPALADGVEYVQITQKGVDADGDRVDCPPCVADQRLFARVGVPLRVLSVYGSEAEKEEIARLLDGIEVEMKSTPFYVVTFKGKRYAWRRGSYADETLLRRNVVAANERLTDYKAYLAGKAEKPPSAVAERAPAEPGGDKLDRIINAIDRLTEANTAVLSELRKGSPEGPKTAALQ